MTKEEKEALFIEMSEGVMVKFSIVLQLDPKRATELDVSKLIKANDDSLWVKMGDIWEEAEARTIQSAVSLILKLKKK